MSYGVRLVARTSKNGHWMHWELHGSAPSTGTASRSWRNPPAEFHENASYMINMEAGENV